MNFEYVDDTCVKQIYRQAIRFYRKTGSLGFLRLAAECRSTLKRRKAFRAWMERNANSLPM